MKKELPIPEGISVKKGTMCKVISTIGEAGDVKLGEIVIWNDDYADSQMPYIKHKNGKRDIVYRSNLQIIKNNKMNKTKTIKQKAEWKVGDVVYNDYNSQKSKVLAVSWDSENESYKYTLQCQDDNGSIHLVTEDNVSEVEVIKMTVAELKAYYEENENCEVEIKK